MAELKLSNQAYLQEYLSTRRENRGGKRPTQCNDGITFSEGKLEPFTFMHHKDNVVRIISRINICQDHWLSLKIVLSLWRIYLYAAYSRRLRWQWWAEALMMTSHDNHYNQFIQNRHFKSNWLFWPISCTMLIWSVRVTWLCLHCHYHHCVCSVTL